MSSFLGLLIFTGQSWPAQHTTGCSRDRASWLLCCLQVGHPSSCVYVLVGINEWHVYMHNLGQKIMRAMKTGDKNGQNGVQPNKKVQPGDGDGGDLAYRYLRTRTIPKVCVRTTALNKDHHNLTENSPARTSWQQLLPSLGLKPPHG